MSELVDQFEEPVLSPEAALVLHDIEEATAAAGFPIADHAKLNSVGDTLVGPDDAPVNLGPTVELTISIADDGAPLPPFGQRMPGEAAAAVMIIRVAPERSFGVLCWRAWVNLVEVSTTRALFSQQSAKADEHWDAIAAVSFPTVGESADLDIQLDAAITGITQSLPRTAGEAITQAFGASVEDGRLTLGREWSPPIKRLRFATPEQISAATSSDPDDQSQSPDDESAPTAASTREPGVTWSSTFALVGAAASIGLVVGLVILWFGGNATAHTSHEADGIMVGQLLASTSEDGVEYERILAFRYNDQLFPVTLFRADQSDATCAAEHVHLATTEPHARPFDAPDEILHDPDPTGCGFGTVNSLEPALYPIPHEQLHTFCQLYRSETPDQLATDTIGLCQLRDPSALP